MTCRCPVSSRGSDWFRDTLGEPTPAQAQGWAAIRERRHTLIAAPTGSGKTLAAFLTALDDLFREGLDAPLPDEVRVVYVSPLKALSADIHKNLAEPRRGIRAAGRGAGTDGAADHRRRAHRRHDVVRARGDAAHAAAHPGDDARVAVPAADRPSRSREMLRTARTVIVDEIHAVIGTRRGAHLALTLERLQRVAERAAAPARPVGNAEADRGGRALSRRVQARDGAGELPIASIVDEGHRRAMDLGARSAALGARCRDVARGLERVLRAPDRAHRGAPHDAGLRQHAADGRAPRARAERAARRGRRHGASRQPVEGEATRRRVAPEERAAEGAGRHRVARARHRHRPRRSRLPDRIAASHRDVPAARRPIRPHGRGPAEGTAVPGLARRSRRVRGAAARGAPRRARSPSSRTTRRSTCWRSRSSPKPRARTTPRTSSSLWCRRAWPYRALDAIDVRRRRADDRRRLRDQRGRRARARPPRRGQRAACAAGAARACLRDHVRRRDSRKSPTTASCSIPRTRSSARSTRTSRSRARPATCFSSATPSWQILQVGPGVVRVADAQGAPPTMPFWLGEAPARSDELSRAVSDLRARRSTSELEHDRPIALRRHRAG